MNLYPNVDTLTIDQLRDLIAAGDDSHHNQLRITSSREIFLSDIVGLEHLEGIIGRFETFVAGNGYVGLNAAFVHRINGQNSAFSYFSPYRSSNVISTISNNPSGNNSQII